MKSVKALSVAAALLALIVAFPARAYASGLPTPTPDVLTEFYGDLISNGEVDFINNSAILGGQDDVAPPSQSPGQVPEFTADFLIVPNADPNEPQRIISNLPYINVPANQLIFNVPREYYTHNNMRYLLFTTMNFYNVAPGDSQGISASVMNTDAVNSTLYLWANGIDVLQTDKLTGNEMAGMLCDRSCEVADCCEYREGQPCECAATGKLMIDQLLITIRVNNQVAGQMRFNSGRPAIFNLAPGQMIDISVDVELPGRNTCNAYMYKASKIQLTFDLSGIDPGYYTPPIEGGGDDYPPSYPTPRPGVTPPPGNDGGDGTVIVPPDRTEKPQETPPTGNGGDEPGEPIIEPSPPLGGGEGEMPKTGEAPLYYNLIIGLIVAGLGVYILSWRKNAKKENGSGKN